MNFINSLHGRERKQNFYRTFALIYRIVVAYISVLIEITFITQLYLQEYLVIQ